MRKHFGKIHFGKRSLKAVGHSFQKIYPLVIRPCGNLKVSPTYKMVEVGSGDGYAYMKDIARKM